MNKLIYIVVTAIALLFSSRSFANELLEQDTKAIFNLFQNKEFKRYQRLNYKKGDEITLDFDKVKDDLAKVHYQCKVSIFKKSNNVKRLTNLLIQQNLYGYPRAVENGKPYRLVKSAIDFPALSNEIEELYIQLVEVTGSQYEILLDDLARFNTKYLQEMEESTAPLSSYFKKLRNEYGEKYLEKLPKEELTNWAFNISSFACFEADDLLAMHGYSHVDGEKVNSWFSAQSMLKSIRKRALANLANSIN